MVVPNIKGIVREVLPCDYYRVGYQRDGCEGTVTLFATMMAMTCCQAPQDQECNTPLSDTTELKLSFSSICDKVCEYALNLRERLTSKSKSYDCKVGEGGNHHMNNILKEANLSPVNIEVNNEVDLFCHACDYSFLAVHENDPSLSATYSQYVNSIMRFLHERKFSYYFSSIRQWESSRSQTPAILYQPYIDKTPPIFIEAEHTCSSCADRMQPCAHPCCKLWFQEVSRKCGYSHPDTQTCIRNAKMQTEEPKQMKTSQESKYYTKTKVTLESFSNPKQKGSKKYKERPKNSTSASLLHNFPIVNSQLSLRLYHI